MYTRRGQNRTVSESENLPPSLRWTSILRVWGAAVVFAVVIGVVSDPHAYASWLALALAGCVIGALASSSRLSRRRGSSTGSRRASVGRVRDPRTRRRACSPLVAAVR